MATPKISDGTDTIELNFDGDYNGPLAEPKRPTLNVPKKAGNPRQDLGRGNKVIEGAINITDRTQLNGSNAGDPDNVADKLQSWHNNATQLTWTDEDGNTLTVTLAIQSHTKTRVPDKWHQMVIELEEDV